MRKMLLIGIIGFLSVFLVYGLADAKVGGRCVNCHTMHGSQNGVDWVWLKDGAEPDGPYGSLLVGTCLGCHTAPTGTSDPYPAAGTYMGYPFVKSADDAFNDTNCLAGGFFTDSELGSDNSDGNTHTFGSTTAPPGYDESWYTGGTDGLGCAGTAGCHGSQTEPDPMAAISGGHHQTASYGYRILAAYNGGTPAAVDGGGDVATYTKDYEKDLISSVNPAFGVRSSTEADYYHNIYSAGAGSDTISKLCANCHGVFHSDTQSGGAWIRHPTDIALPAYSAGPPVMWEPQNDTVYNEFDAKYNPFGFTDVSDTTGTKYVTCLSCHRAHGTEQYDLLRFKYTTGESGEQIAGRYDGTPATNVAYGCLGCHSGQR
jgi:hypothetical protein